jgi:hypothetical protein
LPLDLSPAQTDLSSSCLRIGHITEDAIDGFSTTIQGYGEKSDLGMAFAVIF